MIRINNNNKSLECYSGLWKNPLSNHNYHIVSTPCGPVPQRGHVPQITQKGNPKRLQRTLPPRPQRTQKGNPKRFRSTKRAQKVPTHQKVPKPQKGSETPKGPQKVPKSRGGALHVYVCTCIFPLHGPPAIKCQLIDNLLKVGKQTRNQMSLK